MNRSRTQKLAVSLLKRAPRPLYDRLKRAPVVAPFFRRALDLLIERGTLAPTPIEGGPLKGMVVELDPRANKDMIVGRYEPEVIAMLESLLDRGGVAYDVGAHLGYETLVMAAAGPGARIWSFEPDPDMFSVLSRNLAGNRSERTAEVTPVRAALGAVEGRALFARGETTGIGRLTPGAGDLEVDVTTLDEAAARYEAPAVVKIDVEGGELEVLKGGTKLLEEGRAVFLIEAHSQTLDDECRSVLQSFGYSCETLGRARAQTTHFVARPPKKSEAGSASPNSRARRDSNPQPPGP